MHLHLPDSSQIENSVQVVHGICVSELFDPPILAPDLPFPLAAIASIDAESYQIANSAQVMHGICGMERFCAMLRFLDCGCVPIRFNEISFSLEIGDNPGGPFVF